MSQAQRDAARRVQQLLPGLDTLPEGAPVPSPCNCTCRIDPASGWCDGCLRTIGEVTAWSGLDAAAKRAVWHALGTRATTLLANR